MGSEGRLCGMVVWFSVRIDLCGHGSVDSFGGELVSIC